MAESKPVRYRVLATVFVNGSLIEPKGRPDVFVWAAPGLEGKSLELAPEGAGAAPPVEQGAPQGLQSRSREHQIAGELGQAQQRIRELEAEVAAHTRAREDGVARINELEAREAQFTATVTKLEHDCAECLRGVTSRDETILALGRELGDARTKIAQLEAAAASKPAAKK